MAELEEVHCILTTCVCFALSHLGFCELILIVFIAAGNEAGQVSGSLMGVNPGHQRGNGVWGGLVL